jgi:DnaJ like chaperone protein
MAPPQAGGEAPARILRCAAMNIWGKILGGAAGFALGGPLGALLGAVAGHAVDRLAVQPAARASEADERAATRQIAFTIGIIVLGAKMAKADGVVSRSEIAAFKQVFTVPADQEANVGRIFDQARRDARGFEPYAQQVARLFHRKSRILEELLDGLFHIAKADGRVSEHEIVFLRGVAEIFGFDAADFARIRESHLGPDAADPYNILGVTRAQDNAAIKAAYRRLVRDSHPDRLIAKGLPEEAIAIANARLATINAAYDRVCKERGIA